MLERFRQGAQLPPGYGRDLDERCVEYPWCLANLPTDAKRVLDAGSVFNTELVLASWPFRQKVLHILTLAPENTAFWRRGISYIYGDLREIPIRDGYYDAVVCLSTLEHIGMDNTPYTHGGRSARGNEPEFRRNDFIIAMRELVRVLRPGGVLLCSVPYGMYEDRHRIQQFDHAMLHRAVEAASPAAVSMTFFRSAPTGWQLARQDECEDARFGVWGTSSAGRSRGVVPGAEAVACVRLEHA